MAETWPNDLQQCLNEDSFQVQLGSTTIRTDVDTGPAKVRSRFTDAIDTVNCSINIDRDLYASFLTFFKTTLNNGVRTFNFFDPITGALNEYRFLEPPSVVPIGGRYFKIQMRWEKLINNV